MAILACAAIAFISCEKHDGPVDPDPKPGEDTTKTEVKVTVTPHEVVLTAEESTVRLSATLEPADASVTVEWSSSDTLVATVTSRGIVEAIGYGECYVYASVGTAKDSCLVQVKSYLETLIFNSAIVWDEDTTYALDTVTGKYKVDTLKASDGTTYYAYKSMALLRIFSDGFYVNNEGYIDGTTVGTVIDVNAPMYYAPGWMNNSTYGTVFCLGEWDVTDDIMYMRQGKPGYITDEKAYVKDIKDFIDSYNAGAADGAYLKAASELFDGSTMTIYEYDAEQGGYSSSHIPDAVCDEAHVSLNGDFSASQYMCGLDYSVVQFTALDYNWGIELDQAEDGSFVLANEEIHWADPIVSTYGEIPSEEAEAPKALKPIRVPIIKQNPALADRIEKQIKEKGIQVIKVKR